MKGLVIQKMKDNFLWLEQTRSGLKTLSCSSVFQDLLQIGA